MHHVQHEAVVQRRGVTPTASWGVCEGEGVCVVDELATKVRPPPPPPRSYAAVVGPGDGVMCRPPPSLSQVMCLCRACAGLLSCCKSTGRQPPLVLWWSLAGRRLLVSLSRRLPGVLGCAVLRFGCAVLRFRTLTLAHAEAPTHHSRGREGLSHVEVTEKSMLPTCLLSVLFVSLPHRVTVPLAGCPLSVLTVCAAVAEFFCGAQHFLCVLLWLVALAARWCAWVAAVAECCWRLLCVGCAWVVRGLCRMAIPKAGFLTSRSDFADPTIAAVSTRTALSSKVNSPRFSFGTERRARESTPASTANATTLAAACVSLRSVFPIHVPCC